MTLLTVVIPALNAAVTLKDQLEALVRQPRPDSVEILVCDNGSRDGTRNLVRSFTARGEPVHWVDASARRGPSFARNTGAAMSESDVLAFCDADDIVGPNWLVAMADGARRHGYVTGPIDLDALNAPWLVEGRGRWLAQKAPLVYGGVLPFANGCNLAVRRHDFQEVGGFDEGLWVGEDIDLARRLRPIVGPPVWVSEAVVHYRLRGDLSGTWRQSRNYARAHQKLVSRLRSAGLQPASSVRVSHNVVWLVRHASLLRSRSGRMRWVVVAGSCMGVVETRLTTVGLRCRCRASHVEDPVPDGPVDPPS